MLANFNDFWRQRASGRNVLLLFALAVISFWLMAAVITPAFQDATEGLEPLDLNFGVTAEMVYRELPVYTDRSRSLYIWFAIVDYIYPAAVAGFFALLWAWMFRRWPTKIFYKAVAFGILIVPFCYALVDWLENAGFLFVIFSYPTEYPSIANVAGTLKKAKPFFLLTVLVLTFVIAVIAVRQATRSRH